MNINFLTKIWEGLTSATYSVTGSSDHAVYLQFDSIEECSFRGSATATQVPTEAGLNRTDYKYVNPDSVQMKGIVSKNGILGLGLVGASYSISGVKKQSLIEKIRKQCEILTRNIILVDIATRNSGTRKNYTMTDYTIEETPDNFSLFEVTMTFDEVLLFGKEGTLTRNVSDQDLKNIGIVETLAQDLKEWWNS